MDFLCEYLVCFMVQPLWDLPTDICTFCQITLKAPHLSLVAVALGSNETSWLEFVKC